MANQQIGAAAGCYSAGEVRFTICSGLQVSHKRLLRSSDLNRQQENLAKTTVLCLRDERGGRQ